MEAQTTNAPENKLSTDSDKEKLAEIQSVLSCLVAGKLEKRFVHIDEYGSYSGICSDINDLIDKVETFFREAIGRMKDFSEGKTDAQIDERGYENTFLETIRLFNANLRTSADQREQQRSVSQAMQEAVSCLNETVEQMEVTARELGENSTETLKAAESVDHSSQETNSLTGQAANSCNELAAAINEIAASMQQANTVNREAVDLANQTVDTIGELLKSSDQIGKFITLIDGIAHQTNLLSLNASIEAARAGENGRGFAVVAGEVKKLASESQANAKTISKQVATIRSQADESAQAVKHINKVIDQLNNISQSVAAATEEQGTATNSISDIMQDVARAAQDISTSISSVAGSARQNTGIATHVTQRISTLSSISENLKSLAQQLET